MDDPAAQGASFDDAAQPSFASGATRFQALVVKTLADHGIFRLGFRNWHCVAPGMFRSNQPYPYQLAWAAAAGIKTVVNLRGASPSSYYLLESDACAALGLRLVNFKVFSRALPAREVLHDARSLFGAITYPALMHCKSGADRAGLMSALYLLIREGRPVDQAMEQLSIKFGHFRQARTGILDAFLAAYRHDHAETGIGFFDWVDNSYDPQKIESAFHDARWASVLVDRVLHHE